MQKLSTEWPRNKIKYEICLAKAENNRLADTLVEKIAERIRTADLLFADITKANNAIQVKGKGYYHEGNLKDCINKCEEID